MKSIVWLNLIFILEPGTIFSFYPTHIRVTKGHDGEIVFIDSKKLAERIDKDKAFAHVLEKAAQFVIIKFLSEKEMPVLDLENTLLTLKVNDALAVPKEGEASAER